MERIGVRELRQHASVWLQKVQEGKSFEVTVRGRPVALLVPAPRGSKIDQLVAAGRLRPGKGNLLGLGLPLPAHPGEETLSDILERMRADER
jgi:prevent-host-death family protein